MLQKKKGGNAYSVLALMFHGNSLSKQGVSIYYTKFQSLDLFLILTKEICVSLHCLE